jgi:precorrin-6Y C5,15-methyltransferase (decarboxylating)
MPVIADGEFMRAKVPMTKENIRHLSIIKLGLKEDSVLYDIGSGTGAVSCEAAMQSSGLKVYAIEMRKAACDLIEKNAEKFGLSNIEVVNGKAPEAFEGLEAPTHAFIGGSSGSLKEMLDVLSGAPGSVRVVINAVSLETMAEIQSILSEYAITDLSIEQISVTRSRELGKYHLMTAENPVIIAAFTLGERE